MFLISSERANCAARILLLSVVAVSDFSHTRVPNRNPPKRRRDRNAIRVVAIRSSSRVNPASPFSRRKKESRSVVVIVVVVGAGLGIEFQRRKSDCPKAAVAVPGNGRDDLGGDGLPRGAVRVAAKRLDLHPPLELVDLSRGGPVRKTRSGLGLTEKRLGEAARGPFVRTLLGTIEALQKNCQKRSERNAENRKRHKHFDECEAGIAGSAGKCCRPGGL